MHRHHLPTLAIMELDLDPCETTFSRDRQNPAHPEPGVDDVGSDLQSQLLLALRVVVAQRT